MENQISKIQNQNFNCLEMERKFIEFIDVAEETATTYKKGIKNFMDFLNENNIQNPTRNDVLNWKKNLKDNYSINTVNTYLVAIKAFFNFLELTNLYPNIAEYVKCAKISSLPVKNVLTLEQAKNIYNNLTDIKERAIFGLLITTGLRGIEVTNAKIEHLREINGEICLLVKCKGHEAYDEFVKLPENVFEDIKQYIGNRREGYIFVSSSNNNKNGGLTTKTIRLIIKNIFKRFGYQDSTLSTHSLRRTFACIAYNLGQSIYDIQTILHHKSIQTTTRYLKQADRHNNNSEKLVANAILA